MPPTRVTLSLTFLCILLTLHFPPVNSIVTNCSSPSNCTINSFCGLRGMCVCDSGFILNCTTSALTLTGIPVTAPISAIETYYIIEPQMLYEFLKFSIQLTTTQNLTAGVVASFWGQTGYLTDLTVNPKLQVTTFQLNSTSPATIQTTYFQFGMQPNGQPQMLIMGLQLNSTSLTSIPITLTLEQIPAINQNIFKIILTVLMAILSVSCFIMLGFCIYRRRKMNQMRQRAVQEKQIKPTDHFDQYMPKVSASRVNMPLQVCSVCLTDITIENYVRLTICKHLFHAECIDSWCKKNTSCPICRQQLDLESCQNILGQDFDLSESLTARKMQKNQLNEVEMAQGIRMKKMPSLNGEGSMRRPML